MTKIIDYLMLVPEKRRKMQEYIDETTDLGKYLHQMCYSKRRWQIQTNYRVENVHTQFKKYL
ncbi:MAG: hypothetical protein ACOCWQ_03945 [Nanoarchaeota archaeon]